MFYKYSMQQEQKMLSCSPWRSSHTHKHYSVAAATAAGHAPLERSEGCCSAAAPAKRSAAAGACASSMATAYAPVKQSPAPVVSTTYKWGRVCG